MIQPQRLKRSRADGWTTPPGAIYVGRPTKWGNTYTITPKGRNWAVLAVGGTKPDSLWETKIEAAREAVWRYRSDIEHGRLKVTVDDARRELRGKDLVCWCPLPKPGEPDICHAAVLLEVANA